MKLRKFIATTIREYLNEHSFLQKYHYIEAKRDYENQKMVDKLFREAGWSTATGEYSVDDLDLIDKSKNDLPFPDVTYNEKDSRDYVGSNGELLLPYREIPFSYSSNSFHRPESKEVWYNGKWFVVSYYHDGTPMDIELKK